jgi:hypothetical protein
MTPDAKMTFLSSVHLERCLQNQDVVVVRVPPVEDKRQLFGLIPNFRTPPVVHENENDDVIERLSNIQPPNLQLQEISKLPSPITGIIHHVGVVPTLTLTAKQTLSDSGAALRLVLHSRLQDTRVCKIH